MARSAVRSWPRRRGFHPAGLAALALALLIQAFAPAWAAMVMRALPPAVLLTAVDDSSLCLAGEHPDGHAPQRAHDTLCPVCQAFAAVQVALDGTAPPLPGPLELGRRLRSRRPRTVARRRAVFRPNARAPPVSPDARS